MDYLKFSKKRKLEAERILEETDLFNKLKKFGRVKQIGSYFLDLMIKPDLDFALRIKKDSETNSIIKEILKITKGIKKISLKKVVDRKKFGLNGKTLNLFYHGKELWGIDIFVSTDDFSAYNRIKKKVKDITLKQKKTILKLKYYFYKKGEKPRGGSYNIYGAVLDENISNLKQFDKYIGKG